MDERRRREVALAVQMIFQDPFASLNPRMRIAEIIGEAPRVHGLIRGRIRPLPSTKSCAGSAWIRVSKRRYPHQFSGGQRQRIGIARALAVKPRSWCATRRWPRSMSRSRPQILNLSCSCARLGSPRCSSADSAWSTSQHRVMVMYLGRIVEEAADRALFAAPNHPYTQRCSGKYRASSRPQAYRGSAARSPPRSAAARLHFHPRCRTPCRSAAPRRHLWSDRRRPSLGLPRMLAQHR